MVIMRVRVIIIIFCAVASIRLSLAEPAADSSRDPVFGLEPLVVRASGMEQAPVKLPASVSRLDQDDIQKASAQLSINESLQTVPGVFALNPYNYAQDSRIAVRGFGARKFYSLVNFIACL